MTKKTEVMPLFQFLIKEMETVAIDSDGPDVQLQKTDKILGAATDTMKRMWLLRNHYDGRVKKLKDQARFTDSQKEAEILERKASIFHIYAVMLETSLLIEQTRQFEIYEHGGIIFMTKNWQIIQRENASPEDIATLGELARETVVGFFRRRTSFSAN